jgi:hypothetical protein
LSFSNKKDRQMAYAERSSSFLAPLELIVLTLVPLIALHRH